MLWVVLLLLHSSTLTMCSIALSYGNVSSWYSLIDSLLGSSQLGVPGAERITASRFGVPQVETLFGSAPVMHGDVFSHHTRPIDCCFRVLAAKLEAHLYQLPDAELDRQSYRLGLGRESSPLESQP